MGAVYLAEDIRLHRNVALKVLPAEMASNADRLTRFQREAQAVAALNHPHIVTIYSVEQEGDIHFLTMELVEGNSLDRTLPADGLPLMSVFHVGIALADALAAAHDKGIVHRDLKPANVMVTKDGRVKVLDFGLAKLAIGGSDHTTAGGSLTDVGVMIGTVPYMSPEQAGGELVDARSDIFSLGVMLYELATGRRPFTGKNAAETISSIVRDAPRPVTEIRQEAPRHLARIIEHCLQKDPEARFQTAKDIRNELRALRTEVESSATRTDEAAAAITSPLSRTTVRTDGMKRLGFGVAASVIVGMTAVLGVVFFRGRGHERPQPTATPALSAFSAADAVDSKSIAVLPFVDMSQGKDQQYFSDGVSEELLNLLAKIPELKVAARTSSFSFKGKAVEIPDIARQLHVAHVLEGSVRKAGKQVRITAQLIHAADGFHLWSQTYDRQLDDIFKIQDEIAADVVKELKVTLLGAPPKVRTTDPEAYALYLQGMQLGLQATPDAFAKSDALFRQVLAIDPRYAPAWSALATNALNELPVGVLSSKESFARALETATKALEIDPAYAPAHATLGFRAMMQSDLPGAAQHYERALALDPSNPKVLAGASSFLAALGRSNEQIALLNAVTRRDPVNIMAHFNLGLALTFAGRYDEGIASFRTSLNLSPGRGSAHAWVATSLLLKGDAGAALAEVEQEKNQIYRMLTLPMVYHALGRTAESDATLAALTAKYEKDAPYNIAYVYAFRREADKAFAWLDKAIEYDDPGLFEIASNGLFANIRTDPRWLPFLRRIGKAPEQLAKIPFKVTLPNDR